MQRNKCLRFRAIIPVMALMLVLTGCAASYEPEEIAYVLAVGFDHGASNLARITYLIANPQQISASSEGGGGGAQKPFMTVTIEAPSIYASLNMADTFLARRVSLMHTKLWVFSEAIARDGSLARIIPGILQFRQIRGTSVLAISKDAPEKVLENLEPPFSANPAKFIELLTATSHYTGEAPLTTLREFYNFLAVEGANNVCALLSISEDKLPPNEGQGSFKSEGDFKSGELVKKGGSAIEYIGAAVFDSTRMVGELTGDENVFYSMLTGKFRTGIYSFKDPLDEQHPLSMQLFQSKSPKIDVQITPEEIYINAEVSLDGNLIGNPSLVDYALPQNRPILEQHISEHFKKRMEAFVRRTQKEFKSDILRFGLEARKLVLTLDQWHDINWNDRYPEAVVQVNVDFKIRRTGLNYHITPAVDPEKGIREGVNPR